MSYMGNAPIIGMTVEQQRACEAACKLAPEPYWHDGLMRGIASALVGDPPWTDDPPSSVPVRIMASRCRSFLRDSR